MRGPLKWIGVVVSAVFGVFFGLVLGAAVVAAIATTFFDYHVVVVASDSMQPSIDKGDIVVTKRADTSKLKEGDVILFTENGVPVIHRITSIQKLILNLQNSEGQTQKSATRYQYVTKGDANPNPDAGQVAGENVVGELMWTIPGFGIFRDGMDPRVIMFMVAAGIGVLWLLWEIGSRIVGRRRRNGPGDPTPAPEASGDDWSPESALTMASIDPPASQPQQAAPPHGQGNESPPGVHS